MPHPGGATDGERAAFIGGMSTRIAHITDDSQEIWSEFGVVSFPSMVFVAADGSYELHSGAIDRMELLDRATTL